MYCTSLTRRELFSLAGPPACTALSVLLGVGPHIVSSDPVRLMLKPGTMLAGGYGAMICRLGYCTALSYFDRSPKCPMSPVDPSLQKK